MNSPNLVSLTETYVRENMSRHAGRLAIAHDYQHVERVRNKAVIIAAKEGFRDKEAVELAALLHDIGLTSIKSPANRDRHGSVGAEMAARFLTANSSFSPAKVEWIADAIRYHSVLPHVRTAHLATLNEKRLTEILCDADMLDSLGALGLIRGLTSKYFLPGYDPINIRGPGWGRPNRDYWASFENKISDQESHNKSIVDQINQQIRRYESLQTKTARELGRPLVEYMQGFILQLEREVNG